MGDNIWIWAIQFLVGILLAIGGFWARSIITDNKSLWKEYNAMKMTMYTDFATKNDVGKLEVKIENLGTKIEGMPDRIMVKIEKLLEKRP